MQCSTSCGSCKGAHRCGSRFAPSTSTRVIPATRRSVCEYIEREGYDFLVSEDTYSIVTEKIPTG